MNDRKPRSTKSLPVPEGAEAPSVLPRVAPSVIDLSVPAERVDVTGSVRRSQALLREEMAIAEAKGYVSPTAQNAMATADTFVRAVSESERLAAERAKLAKPPKGLRSVAKKVSGQANTRARLDAQIAANDELIHRLSVFVPEDRRHGDAEGSLGGLQEDVADARRAYLFSVTNSDSLLSPKTPLAEKKAEMNTMHSRYTNMMVASLLTPLTRGVNFASLLGVVGSGAMMWMVSPNFRDQAKGQIDKVNVGLTKYFNDRGANRGKEAQALEAEAIAQGRSLRDSGKRRDRRWVRELDKLAAQKERSRGCRDYFTMESAALTEIGLDQNYYLKMRDPGLTDRAKEQMAADFAELKAQLVKDVEADDVAYADVLGTKNRYVAKHMAEDPSLAEMYSELAHGRMDPAMIEVKTWTRADGVEVSSGVTTGRFTGADGQAMPISHALGVRARMGPDEHYYAMGETMAREMVMAAKEGDLVQLESSIFAYSRAMISLEPDPKRQSPEEARAHRMMRSMTRDGFTPEQAQEIYVSAYVDAMEVVAKEYPDIEKQWAERYGNDWQARMEEVTVNEHAHEQAFGDGRASSVKVSTQTEDAKRREARYQARVQADRRRDRRAGVNVAMNEGRDVTAAGPIGGSANEDWPSP